MKIRWIILLISSLGYLRGISQNKIDFTVATDGSGDFATVQAAFDAVPDFRKNQTTIFIKKGIYKEKLTLATTKTNVMLIGEQRDSTILTWDDFASKKNRFGEEMGTTASSSFFVFGDDFTAEDLTFENSAGPVGQAVAVRVDGDRAAFINCKFLGNQDTLYPHGERSRQYYKNCYIEGTVDYIFGWSTALFENCVIHSKSAGYITAASTLETMPYGFIFLNCKIEGSAPENSVYLGRPWRPFARTVFVNCYLGKHIRKEGWHNWDKPDAEKTSYYAEFNSTGPGSIGPRVNWSRQLTRDQANQYTFKTIMGDWELK